MNFRTWYDQLGKHAWTPSPRAISIIWTILYPIIFITFGFVFYQWYRGAVPRTVALPFIINLVANILFMPIFAGLRNQLLATVDIVVVWGTIIWIMAVIWPQYRWVAVAQVPYLVWVSIATVAQCSITWLNR
jgi:tryptophan-rich sensory protein